MDPSPSAELGLGTAPVRMQEHILHSSDVGRAVELMSMTLQELKQHVGGKYANWPELWHAAAAAQPNLSQKKWLQSVAQSILLQNPLAAPGDVALPPRGMAQPIAPAHPTATAIPVAPAHPIATAIPVAPAHPIATAIPVAVLRDGVWLHPSSLPPSPPVTPVERTSHAGATCETRSSEFDAWVANRLRVPLLLVVAAMLFDLRGFGSVRTLDEGDSGDEVVGFMFPALAILYLAHHCAGGHDGQALSRTLQYAPSMFGIAFMSCEIFEWTTDHDLGFRCPVSTASGLLASLCAPIMFATTSQLPRAHRLALHGAHFVLLSILISVVLYSGHELFWHRLVGFVSYHAALGACFLYRHAAFRAWQGGADTSPCPTAVLVAKT